MKKVPTDHNDPFWQGYDQAMKNVRMIFLDLSCVGDDLRDEVISLYEHINSRCGTVVMLQNVRSRDPSYRRKQIRLVK